MDLSKLSVRKGTGHAATLHLKHPFTGEPLECDGKPVTLQLLGIGCDAGTAKVKEQDKRRTRGETIDAAQTGAELLAAVTVGWSNIGLGSETDLPFSFDNAVKLYTDPDSEWIAEQAFPFANNRKNYLSGLSTD